MRLGDHCYVDFQLSENVATGNCCDGIRRRSTTFITVTAYGVCLLLLKMPHLASEGREQAIEEDRRRTAVRPAIDEICGQFLCSTPSAEQL